MSVSLIAAAFALSMYVSWLHKKCAAASVAHKISQVYQVVVIVWCNRVSGGRDTKSGYDGRVLTQIAADAVLGMCVCLSVSTRIFVCYAINC